MKQNMSILTNKFITTLSKYWIFILFFLLAAICFVKKNSYLTTQIASNPNTKISFSTENTVLEQTWQPHIKKITEVSIPYTSMASFDAEMKLEIFTDDYNDCLLSLLNSHSFKVDESDTLTFSFDTLKLIPGERYRIRFSYVSFSSNGEMLIDACSDYTGCCIDGNSCESAAALSITFVKNSRLFWLLAVTFPLLSFSFLFMVLWNRKWEEVIGLSLITSVFLLFISGLLNKLLIGIKLLYILSIICFIIAFFIYIKKQLNIRSLASPGLFVWCILFVLIMLTCHNMWLARWDEYTHWGLAVKDMFYYNSFAKHFNTTVMLPRYLPFSTLAEYLFVYPNELFSEDLLYMGFQVILLCVLVIVCRPAKQKYRYLIPSLAIMVLVPVIFFQDVTNCIYVDPLLAVFTAYIFICYYGEEKSVFNWLCILGGLFALSTVKDMGVVIAGLLVLVIIADTAFKQIKAKKLHIRSFIIPLSLLVAVFMFFFIWQIFLNIPVQNANPSKEISKSTEASEIVTQEFTNSVSASKVSIDGILDILSGNGKSYQYKSIKNFIIKLFDEDTYYFGNLGMSYMDISLFILLLIGILCYINFWNNRDTFFSFGCFSFLAGLCYLVCLEVFYLFTFSLSEALDLASHERYWASYLCGVVIAFFYFLICQLSKLSEKTGHPKYWIIATCFSVILTILVPMNNLVMKNMDISISKELKYGYDEMEEALRSFSSKSEKIYYICSNSSGGSYYMFRNTACPLIVPYSDVNIIASEESAQMQKELYAAQEIEMNDKSFLSAEKWAERLSECQYVFIMNADEMFRKDYAELFEQPETISTGTFYQVLSNGTDVRLHYIGQVSVGTYF